MKVIKGTIDGEKFLKSSARRCYVQGALAMVKKIHFGQRDDSGKIASVGFLIKRILLNHLSVF